MIREGNLHELVRAIVDAMRLEHPDRILDLEHRGDGEGEWDPDALTRVVAALLHDALAYAAPSEPVWTRTDGRDAHVRIHLQYRGDALPQVAGFEAFGGVLEERVRADGIARVRIRFGRTQFPPD